MAPALTKADPKCGIDTSRMAATNAIASHEKTASSEPHRDQIADSICTGAPRLYQAPEASVRRRGMVGRGMTVWWRAVVFSHRWLGIAGWLVFMTWLATGIVMMYVRMPAF